MDDDTWLPVIVGLFSLLRLLGKLCALDIIRLHYVTQLV